MKRQRDSRFGALGGALALVAAVVCALPARPQQAQSSSGSIGSSASRVNAAAPGTVGRPGPSAAANPSDPPVKPDPKKARESDKQGMRAEEARDWPAAFDAFSAAVKWAPGEREYLLHREQARSRLVQSKMDSAERAAISSRLPEARRELLEASYLDPTNTVVRERLRELSALEPTQMKQIRDEYDLGGEVHLDHLPGKRTLNYRGTTQGAYEEVARQWGVQVAFDIDVQSRQVKLKTEDLDFAATMRQLADMTGTFWRPLQKHLFFVAPDTAQKRKDYGVTLVRTVLLPSSATPQQMTELFRLIRDIAGVTRAELDTRSRTITMRASPQAVAVATSVIQDLEQPVAELILEIEVLEVDRTSAQNYGITPPETTKVFTLTSAQVREAEASEQGLIQVIEQVFGTPGSVSGLTGTQVSGLLNGGQLGVGSLLPPILLFGGGDTTGIVTVPGLAASLSTMLSIVRNGRRILLRAEDGAPATFFVGNRIPVTLAQFSASLGGGLSNIPGVSTTDFPTTDLTTGNAPDFVATASLQSNGFSDLIVANKNDNTLSIFLSNGDGTFKAPITPPQATGTTPVWIGTGSFNSDTTKGGDNIPDLAVVNNGDNSVSILLGDGKGGFTAAPTIQAGSGSAPVSVAVSDFNGDGFQDLAVVNHGNNTVSIFLGNGDGTFSPPAAPKPATLITGRGPSAIAAVDFNGDNKIDLAVTNETDNTVSIFLGNGDGTFGPRTDITVGVAPVYVLSGDFNGDGIADLAVANSGAPAVDNAGDQLSGNSVSILLGNPSTTNPAVGNGTFQTPNSFAAGTTPTSLAVADFNIDGRPDLIVASSGDNALSLLLGVGDGTFGPNLELPVGTNPVSILTADFNGDGKPDAALANEGSNTATVVLNEANFQGSTANGLTGTPFPGVQYIDVGVKVKATPRVHNDDEVSLILNFEISSLVGQSINQVPIIANQTVEQTVRVKVNETAMVAGFRQTQFNGALNGNPGLAEIVGPLDSNRNVQRQDTNLVFLITPRLMALPPERKPHLIYAGRGALEGPGSLGVSPIQRELNRQPQQPTETQPQQPAEGQPQQPQGQQPPPQNLPQGQFPPAQPQPQPQQQPPPQGPPQ